MKAGQRDGVRDRGSGNLFCILILLFILSALLRLPRLGVTFHSSDNAELAARVVNHRGWLWMLEERYGLLISLLVKCSALCMNTLGIGLSEFCWRMPVAVAGSLQAPLTYMILRKCRVSESCAFFGGVAFAVFPLHVMQSRYLWGYEVLGLLFLTLLLITLVHFLPLESFKHIIFLAGALSLYLISHGYFLPVIPCVFFAIVLFSPGYGLLERIHHGLLKNRAYLVWVIPLLLIPLYLVPLKHALRKPTQAGFFVDDHLPGFIGNLGWPMLALLLAGLCCCIAGVLTRWRSSTKENSNEDGPEAQREEGKSSWWPGLDGLNWHLKLGMFFIVCGLLYLTPLFFFTPPGLTVIRGYMLCGTSLLLIGAFIALDQKVGLNHTLPKVIATFLLVITGWATTSAILCPDQAFYRFGVRPERGCVVDDPGSKAAGYLAQKHVPEKRNVLALHKALEPPNLMYYFRRQCCAYYDLNGESRRKYLDTKKDRADVVICGEDLRPVMESIHDFPHRTVLFSGEEPQMWIYSRRGSQLPSGKLQIAPLNRKFDEEYSWTVNMW